MEHIRTLTQEFDVGDRAQLQVDGHSCSVTVRGDETRRVRIEVAARLWADDDGEADEQAALILRGIRQDDGRITVREPTLLLSKPVPFFAHGPRIDYQLTVPRKTLATIGSLSGRVEVQGVAGPLQIDARSGRVAVRDIGGDTQVLSRSGRVELDSIAGSVSVDSRSGNLRVSGCQGALTVKSRRGSVHVEGVGGQLKVEQRCGSLRYEGDVRAAFDIDVGSGSVRLALNPDARFFLDAETARGSVRSDLRLRHVRGGGSGDLGPTVRVRTRSGSIHIMPR